ncbi:MAG TPA: fused MFS/spermidine synthase [Vicinamibacteria bacterium]|jgi:spermidine synthase
MTASARRVAALLFGSGFCALVYQTVWLREFRLVFGASTAASAAVLAIFIGGLGLGGLLIGPRADRHTRPLWLYGRLESLIALSAACTPVLFALVREVHLLAGGTPRLGLVGGTVVRLLLAAAVLAVPTLLMGGTLPAAARAVATTGDRDRRSVALLYGVNTLGAVCGAFLGTFFLLEAFGNRRTLWLACLLNLLVAIVARQVAVGLARDAAAEPAPEAEAAAPPAFVLAASAVVGFAFFLMELVWYRMLGPILGGTVFTFGLILAVALLGIGLGGTAYALSPRTRRPTLAGFAATCLLEALCLAVPFALGDRLAVGAQLLRHLGSLGVFWGHVLGWTAICSIVILPAAIVAGYQFPMLLALLGRGKEQVGRQTGLAYAWNTGGAIAGSLAGGFGLLPLLSAPGAWRAVVLLLVAQGAAAIALATRDRATRWRLVVPAAVGGLALLALRAPGPSAAWRHSGIGAGRGPSLASLNDLEEWLRYQRRRMKWEADGIESSVGVQATGAGRAFVINGKIDGNCRGDASTMIMSGLLGALLHPEPRRSLVVGLGTGGTAGWLAAVPTMERTDVVELEPRVLDVARDCASINHGVLGSPKVRFVLGDAREVLLVSRDAYDLVVSEPSNPYRAGVASLFTREFYRAVAHRLAEGGLFLQWVQAYEVDAQTVRTVYATLASVFPEVETWQASRGDLLLVASMGPTVYDARALRERLRHEPYASGVRVAWRATDLEGVLARLVASSSLPRAVARAEGDALNTDDRNRVEFGFARGVGRIGTLTINEIRETAAGRGEHRRAVAGVDWDLVEEQRIPSYPRPENAPGIHQGFSPSQRALAAAFAQFNAGAAGAALNTWRGLGREPRTLTELALVASGLAEGGDEGAVRYIDQVRAWEPLEAEALLAYLRAQQGREDEAARVLAALFTAYRSDPWPPPDVMRDALSLARQIGERRPGVARPLFEALSRPFALDAFEAERVEAQGVLAPSVGDASTCRDLVASLEPNVPWTETWLVLRQRCYAAAGDGRLAQATADLRTFHRRLPARFQEGVPSAEGAHAGDVPAAAPGGLAAAPAR